MKGRGNIQRHRLSIHRLLRHTNIVWGQTNHREITQLFIYLKWFLILNIYLFG